MEISEAGKDFPVIRKGGIIYLDSACQSLRPDSVIKAMIEYYEDLSSCGGRSVHGMASKVSVEMDETRERLASFFGTKDPDCYIFTKNCTEGLNTVARGLHFSSSDTVVTTDTEHNSNHVPWLLLSKETGIKRRFSKSSSEGEFNIEEFKKCMDRSVKLVSICHSGNVTGCVVPVKEVTEIAHDYGAEVLVDGSQAAPHMKVDLDKLDVEYYSLSVHKMLGPSGMGILYGKRECLNKLKPLCSGGGTVGTVTYDTAESAPIPDKFEAGLQNYSGIMGTKAAIEYIERIGMENITINDRALMKKILSETEDIKGLEVVGPKDNEKRCGVFSFNIKGMSPHDVAMMLDKADNIMIRSGMHCSHPFFLRENVDGSARASVYLYNTTEDVIRFSSALRKIAETFSH